MGACLMREISFLYKGAEYSIPATKAFQIGEQVEEIITLAEIAAWAERPRMYKLARCYALMLRFAGCRNVTEAQVFEYIMGGDGDADGAAANAGAAITALVSVLLGGAPDVAEDAVPGKSSAS
jgi:hypothetical protein